MIIDSHCHIDFSDFDADRAAVLQLAGQCGIDSIIVPGVTQKTWHKIQQCCEEYTQLKACYGLHPYFIDQHSESDLLDLHSWIQNNRPVAVGECGLDFFLKHLDKERQHYFFEQQLDIAVEHNLPVVIHARKSTEAVIEAIKQRPTLRGMIHSYSGSYEQAIKLIDLDFYMSFGGAITYEKSTRLRKTAAAIPLECLLVETDAPDQPVAQSTSRRNEPACILHVINALAELHGTDTDEIAMQTSDNAKRLFQLV